MLTRPSSSRHAAQIREADRAAGEHFTFIAANMPGMCDLTGAIANRAAGWPYHLKTVEAGESHATLAEVRHFDSMNFAARTRVGALIVAEFVDLTCPPTTVYAAYSALRGLKEIINLVSTGHLLPPEVRTAMRDAVRRHLESQRS